MDKKINNDKQKHKYNKNQIIIICLLSIYLISFITILGRYAIKNMNNFFTRSKEFYFNSDKLNKNNPSYQIENWSGVDDYVITINMNSNKNNLVSTPYDIEYDISYLCSDNIICTLSKETGIIYSNSNTDYFNLTIIPNASFKKGDKAYVEVIAKSKSPYENTIRGRFTLVVGQENLSYEIVDTANNPYIELNLTNTLSYYLVDEPFDSYNEGERINIDTYLSLTEENKNKCHSALVTLEFNPSEILLDMTDNAYLNSTNIVDVTKDSYNYIKGISFRIDAISSARVRFYKVDETKDYTYPNENNISIIDVTSK